MVTMVANRYLKCNSDSLVSSSVADCYHTSMLIKEILLNNLKYAAHICGGTATLAEKVGCSKKYLDQILQGFQSKKDKRPRSMGDGMASLIAAAVGEEEHWAYQINRSQWIKAEIVKADPLSLEELNDITESKPSSPQNKTTQIPDAAREMWDRYCYVDPAHQTIVNVVLGGLKMAPEWISESTKMAISSVIKAAQEQAPKPDHAKKSEPRVSAGSAK